MKVTFGMALEGVRPLGTEPSFDRLTCGLQGLTRVLELRLGLANPELSDAQRILAYRAALLRAAQTAERFFSRSLKCDEFATAETLLRWRDELRLAGWSGRSAADTPRRLHDLAEVESLAEQERIAGLGDRLQRILVALDQRSPKLESLHVLDARACLPKVVRQILDRLGAVFVDPPQTANAPIGTDLRRVQDLLLHPQEGVISLSGDSTFEAWTAFSEVTLAHQVAERLREARNDSATATLLSGDDARALQTALAALDEPILPLDACSRHRPILSVLALALRLRWQPLDPLHLLEFLTHPVSPVGGRLRRRLAKVVAKFPGIGSSAWNDAIAEIRTRLQTEHQADAKQLNAELTRVASGLADWINAPRFASTTGAPGGALTATCQRVEQWAREMALTRASEAERGQFLAAATQAAEVGVLLQELPSVTPAEVDRLLEQTGSGGAACGDEFAEAGHVHRARSPGAVLENPDVLVWWDFQGSPGAKGSNWTRVETAVFQDQGIELIPTAAALEAATLAAFRPILAARERLVLAVPRQRAGRPLPMHPLHNRLDALLKGGLPLRDLDVEIRHGTGVARLKIFGRRPLPPLKRWWKLTSGQRLAARETESFTGIQMLVYDPFAWVLRYKAKLQPGALESIDERRQRGNLLHRVTERIFIDHAPVNWRSATEPEFSAWLRSYWPELLATEGANFLLPGRQGDGERLRQEAQMAVWRLITHLRNANVSRADSKVRPNDAPFGSGTLTGEIDLVVETPAGACAVIDLKASGLARKHAELVKNIPLQLATYGFLRYAAGGAWPVGAYFIFRRGMLLAEDRAFFSGARVSASKNPPGGLEACWRDFERIWQWRLDQLARGWVELPLPGSTPSDGTTSEPASAPPDPRWVKDPKAKRYDPYTVLSGWNPEQ